MLVAGSSDGRILTRSFDHEIPSFLNIVVSLVNFQTDLAISGSMKDDPKFSATSHQI